MVGAQLRPSCVVELAVETFSGNSLTPIIIVIIIIIIIIIIIVIIIIVIVPIIIIIVIVIIIAVPGPCCSASQCSFQLDECLPSAQVSPNTSSSSSMGVIIIIMIVSAKNLC